MSTPRVTKPECIEVGEGPLGRGVFATQPIAAGEIVEICPTLEVADDAASGRLRDYVFSSNDDDGIAVLPLGYGRSTTTRRMPTSSTSSMAPS